VQLFNFLLSYTSSDDKSSEYEKNKEEERVMENTTITIDHINEMKN
jgi:hypothetical protein